MPSISTKQLVRRRIRNCVLLFFALALLFWSVDRLQQSLWHASYLTGYLLMASFVVLTMFGMRKRLSFIPNIGSASFWMQLHIYVGLATFAIFGWHIGWKIPNGIFEFSLAILFSIVGISGLYGLLISRTYPAKLSSLGGEVVYENIPLIRSQIASQTRQLILQSGQSADVLGRFYVNRLAAFFEQPRGWAYFAMPNGRMKRQLVSDISDLDRYLDEDQRLVSRQLAQAVEQRDRLDYHGALQGRLKLWLFVHIGFTYSLLMCSIVHAIAVHAFVGTVA